MYTYFDLKNVNAYIIQGEDLTNDGADLFDLETYRGANIDGAVSINHEKVSISLLLACFHTMKMWDPDNRPRDKSPPEICPRIITPEGKFPREIHPPDIRPPRYSPHGIYPNILLYTILYLSQITVITVYELVILSFGI